VRHRGDRRKIASRRQASRRSRWLIALGGFTLTELLIVVAIIAVLVAIALPNYIKIKDKAKEAETKASLHNIQLSLEQHAVDNQGEYPAYLIGGDNTALVMKIGERNKYSFETFEIPAEHCSDPLIRKGYIDTYQHNPFVRNPLAIQRMQADVGDPLLSSTTDGQELGTRFGPQGGLIGQVLCEARYLTWQYYNQDEKKFEALPTWSNIQYNFFDVWNGTQRRRAYLPGSFMYKVIGEIVAQTDWPGRRDYTEVDGEDAMVPHNRRDRATYPVSLSNYMLSGWGGFRTHGMDILGEEPLVIFSYNGSRRASVMNSSFLYDPSTGRYNLNPVQTVDKIIMLGIPPWTRGVNRSHVGPLWGSPYGPSTRQEEQLSIGNPNGYKDGLILLLTAGESSEIPHQ